MAASRTTKNYFEALAGVSSDPESAPSEREAAGAVGAAVNHARDAGRGAAASQPEPEWETVRGPGSRRREALRSPQNTRRAPAPSGGPRAASTSAPALTGLPSGVAPARAGSNKAGAGAAANGAALPECLPGGLQRSASHARVVVIRLSGGGGGAAAPPARPQAQAGAARSADSGARPPALTNPLVWLDLEMTGLDPDSDTIIEVACLITDGELEHVIEGPELAIHHGDAVLAAMNEWSERQHGGSGLTQRCRESAVSMRDAEDQVLAFVAAHTAAGAAVLAGNSVHVDAAFLRRRMPRLAAHMHHRIVDVSTVMELCRRWYPRAFYRAPKTQVLHTAGADVRASLEQLRYYRKHMFRRPP